LIGNISNVNLPHFNSAGLLADKFTNFFMTKTTIIRIKTISSSPNNICYISMDADIVYRKSEVEFKEILTKSPDKSSDLDTLLAWLLKKYVDQSLTALTNRSVDDSVMSLSLK